MKKLLGLFISLIVFLPANTAFAQTQNPEILIEKPLIGTYFDIQSDVELSGTATPNSEIILYTNEGEYAKLNSDNEGRWSYKIPTVSEGSATIQAKVNVKIDELSSESAYANVTYIVGPPPSSVNVKELAQTGILTGFLVLAGLLLITLTAWSYIDYKRHKRPLKQANKKINYTFWHHLKVVSLPVMKYRLSISIYKRAPNKSERVRKY